MMFYPSFYPPLYYRRTRNYSNLVNSGSPMVSSMEVKPSFVKTQDSSTQKEKSRKEETRNINDGELCSEYFEIFGLKLYFDDILLICMIFFLYNEGVQDQMLFISLILLLLS